jgi:hypothetical protein
MGSSDTDWIEYLLPGDYVRARGMARHELGDLYEGPGVVQRTTKTRVFVQLAWNDRVMLFNYDGVSCGPGYGAGGRYRLARSTQADFGSAQAKWELFRLLVSTQLQLTAEQVQSMNDSDVAGLHSQVRALAAAIKAVPKC